MTGSWRLGLALTLACFVAAGCQRPAATVADAAPPAPKPPPAPKLDLAVDAGVPLAASADPTRWVNLINAHQTKPRKDPFALSDIERGYEYRQEAERLVLEQGSFTPSLATIVEQEEAPPVVEPQPLDRRLAGVLVGDSILAIIEMGNGRPAEIVRPGQKIAGTDWVVASIDQDKAILRRGGNVLPHEVTVRLQTRSVGAPQRAAATPSNPAFPPNPAGPGAGGGGGGRGARGG